MTIGVAPTPDDAGYIAASPQPLRSEDVVGARSLVSAALGVTPYVDRVLELLDEAAREGDAEARALVIEHDGTIAGLVLFGLVAGATGAARLHALVLNRDVSAADVGGRLTSATATAAAALGARLLVAEIPDDPAVEPMPAVLRSTGFREEARVPDFFRDGTALSVLRLDLDF